jgi:hypothetical protein
MVVMSNIPFRVVKVFKKILSTSIAIKLHVLDGPLCLTRFFCFRHARSGDFVGDRIVGRACRKQKKSFAGARGYKQGTPSGVQEKRRPAKSKGGKP